VAAKFRFPRLEKKDSKPGRKILIGMDILSNNGVNFAMASTVAVVAMIGGGILLGAGWKVSV